MNKEFDFDDIGKKTPYRTPDNFFEDMQQKVMERTYGGQCRKRRLQIMFSTAVAAAAILAGVLFVPSYLQTQRLISFAKKDWCGHDGSGSRSSLVCPLDRYG